MSFFDVHFFVGVWDDDYHGRIKARTSLKRPQPQPTAYELRMSILAETSKSAADTARGDMK